MARKVKRTILITARRSDETEQKIGVFAPAIVANLRMVDLRLKKAGLHELQEYLLAGEEQWIDREEAYEAFRAAGQFFEQHPESIPFSDILMKTFPGILQAFTTIPEKTQVQFAYIEVGHDGLDHGSLVQPEA